MNNLIKFSLVVALLILAVFGGILYGHKMKIFKTHEVEKSEVIMERVAKVFKMVAVEGYVSEIYDYKQYKYWDVNFLRKKAMVRVKAKVSIGFDFEKATFIVDDQNMEIRIENIPEPEILSIDHDLDYYNMDEGLFNSFDEQELTNLNAKAKEYALEMIKNGDLFEEANEQKTKIIDLLKSLLEPTGWKVATKPNKRMIKG